MLQRMGNRVYYYRYVNRDGRCRRVYVACGPAAEKAHAEDLRRQAERAAALRSWRENEARLTALETAVTSLADGAETMTRAHLLAAGFQRHTRGEWRKLHGQPAGPAGQVATPQSPGGPER